VRNKAERRLRTAIKKLESLKILVVELSDGSIGSLSSNGRSGNQAPEVQERNNLGSLSSIDSARSGSPGSRRRCLIGRVLHPVEPLFPGGELVLGCVGAIPSWPLHGSQGHKQQLQL
jgi:hypothetical protein